MTDAKIGRPSIFTEALADEICERLSDGQSLREICRSDDMPAKSTVCKWLALNPAFADQYARAREIQAEALVEESLEIADDASNDWMERQSDDGKSVGWELNGEHVQRSRLRVDTRKWFASKLAPKKYGDAVKLQGDPDAPLQTTVNLGALDETQLDALLTISKKATGEG